MVSRLMQEMKHHTLIPFKMLGKNQMMRHGFLLRHDLLEELIQVLMRFDCKINKSYFHTYI